MPDDLTGMPADVTGRWYLFQIIEGIVLTGTLTLEQKNSEISGNVEWDADGTNDSIVGIAIDRIVSFSVIRAKNLVGHYAAELIAGYQMTRGVCVSAAGVSGSFEARRANQS